MTPEEREQLARERERDRWSRRAWLRKNTAFRQVSGCGVRLHDPELGAVNGLTSSGTVVRLGYTTCGRIWLCPVCEAKIRSRRADQIQDVIRQHIRAGGSAYFVTFTVRHFAMHALASLLAAMMGFRCEVAKADGKDRCAKRRGCTECQAGTWRMLLSGRQWAGGRGLPGHRERCGVVGFIRATEITYGLKSGFHPHLHLVVLTGAAFDVDVLTDEVRYAQRLDLLNVLRLGKLDEARRAAEPDEALIAELSEPVVSVPTYERWRPVGYRVPDADAMADLWSDWKELWQSRLTELGMGPNDTFAMDVQEIRTEADATAIGTYVAKMETANGAVQIPGNELASSHFKEARNGNMTMTGQVLSRLRDLGGGCDPATVPGSGSYEKLKMVWAEYEAATWSRRAIESSRGLWQFYALDVDNTQEGDQDIADGVTGDHEPLVRGLRLTSDQVVHIADRGVDWQMKDLYRRTRDEAAVLAFMAGAGIELTGDEVMTPDDIAGSDALVKERMRKRREDAAARRAAGIDARPAPRRNAAQHKWDHLRAKRLFGDGVEPPF